MKNVLVLNEYSVKKKIKQLISETNFPNLKSLMGMIGKNSDDFGDDIAKNIESLLTKVFSKPINIGVNKMGKQVIKSASGAELPLETLSSILDGINMGYFNVDDVVRFLPEYLPDGNLFSSVFQKVLTKNKPYYKTFQQRTIPIRFGKEYGNGIDEYNSLLNMYKANPQNVAKPLDLVKDEFGNIIGYNMEKLQGKSLYEYLQKSKLDNQQFKKIEDTIKDLHNKGLAHGDINTQNIIMLDDGNIKIIDPVGYPPKNEFPDFQKAVNDDLLKLQNIKTQSLL